MTDTWTETDRDNYFDPGTGEESADDNYASPPPPLDSPEYVASDADKFTLFDAPDYVMLLKHARTARGREYGQKVASIMKMGALGALHSGNLVDGCTILEYGPKFAEKCGDLTDVSDNAARAIDMLTAPDNPWIAFAIIGTPFMLQLLRNHEAQAIEASGIMRKTWRQRRAEKRQRKNGELPQVERKGKPLTVRLPFGRSITLYVPWPGAHTFHRIVRMGTNEPTAVVEKVLSSEKLVKHLEKEGIVIMRKRDA